MSDYISKSKVLEIIHNHSCDTAEIELGVLNLPTVEAKPVGDGFPCKVGDVVELKACCECVSNSIDRETGTSYCPFENDCEFDECDDGNERKFRTTIESIYNIGSGWHASLRHINIEIPLCDFIFGTNIRVVKEEGGIG